MGKRHFLLIGIVAMSFLGVASSLKAQAVPEPIAYWNFNNGAEVNAGLISDITGEYNSVNNNGTWISNGYDGGAISFICKGDNFTCSMKTPGLSVIGNYTLLFRMKVGDISNVNYSRVIFSAYESHAYIYGGLAGDVNERNKITTAQMGNFTVSSDNNWHHYAFIWGHDGKHYFYKDGILVGYAAGPGISNISSAFIFGMAGGLESDINPVITLDEIKVYDQALTAIQIAEEHSYNKLLCASDAWSCDNWSSCSVDGQQTRSCNKTSSCEGGALSPSTTQSCTYVPPCTANDYSCDDWVACSQRGTQTRICSKMTNCQGGISAPTTSQSCTYVSVCTPNSWSCDPWSECSSDGIKTRDCSKISNCEDGTPSPDTTQSCIYTPSCNADAWTCGDWDSCSVAGIQNRSCTRTFDCPSVEDASPSTSRSCTASDTSLQSPNQNENTNRDQILRATVKLECPTPDGRFYSQGSGTIIDEYGSILTNRHVITGTIGTCRVGFITNEDDVPSFSQIADVKSVAIDASANGDMALLKIRNSTGRRFTAIDIFKGNSNNLKSGDTILPFGYPDENLYGQTITFTEGPYSGKGTTIKVPDPCDKPVRYLPINVSGFFKTTASIDHGNSGGGAYQKSTGYYMGMPTLGNSCNPSIPSRINHILSINTIKQWLSSVGSYGITQNNYANLNNYLNSTVKIEDIDVRNLRPLDALTPDAVVSNKIADKSKGREISKIETIPPNSKKKLQPNQAQKESIVIESPNINQKIDVLQPNQDAPKKEQPPKVSRVKRLFSWLVNLFSRMAK